MSKNHWSKLQLLCASTILLSAGQAMAFDGMSAIKPVNETKTHGALLLVGMEDKAFIDGSKSFVEDIAERGLGLLSDDSMSQKEHEAAFRDLLNDNFDMKTIGRFALGRYWRTSSPEERTEYLKLFNEMVVNVYTKRFSEYNGEALKVVSARKDGDSDALVTSKIVPNDGGQSVTVDWRIRFKKNEYKVIDIIVEGVSMSLTQRSDFASVIQRGGGNVEVLLAHLRTDKGQDISALED